MPNYKKYRDCVDCDAFIFTRKGGRCPACATKRVVHNIEQLRSGKGALFDKWKKQVLKTAKKL